MATVTPAPVVPAQLPDVPPVRERRSWPLPFLALDVAAAAMLALAVRRLDGPALVKSILLGGVILAIRRGAAGAWLGCDLVSRHLADIRRRARRAALALSGLAGVAGAAVAAANDDPPAAGVAICLAVFPAVIVALEHQALRCCARRGRIMASGLAGGATTIAVGAVLVRSHFGPLGLALALAAGDLLALVVAWHRPHSGVCAVDGGASSTPLAERGRSLVPAAAASTVLAAMHVLPLATALGSPGEERLVAALVALGLLPLLAATAPSLVIPGLTAGRRETVVPALVLGAFLGGVATLGVGVSPDLVLEVDDSRLTVNAAYFGVAMAVLGLGQLLVHYRVGSGNTRTALVLVLVAAGVQCTLLGVGRGGPADVAVDAALGGALVLVTSLVVATAVAAPFPFTLAAEDAGDGPRLVGPSLVVLIGAAVLLRLASLRPLWLDEATTARLAEEPYRSMFSGSLTADAHPPLHTALTWATTRILGDGALALRLPSLVAGVLLVVVLYATGNELYGRRTGLVAAALGAFAPALIWFSTEARPTALTALLAAGALLAVVRAIRRGRATDWVLFGVAGATLMWTHQLAFVHLVVLHGAAVVCLLRRRREGRPMGSLAAGWAVSVLIVTAAAIPLIAARSGIGAPRVLPPLEFATPAAPGGGASVFATLGTVMNGLVGFHPADVTSRLLALWPLGILATLLVAGRTRSPRGVLLLLLAAAPFVALVAARLLGSPRSPALALGWAATALPVFCLIGGRALSLLAGRWSRVRVVSLGLVALLALAVTDQRARAKPSRRFDVTPVVSTVAREAGPRDVIVYEPRPLGDLVRYKAERTRVVSLERFSPAMAAGSPRVYLVGAFSLTSDPQSDDRAVAIVRELSAVRPLIGERKQEEISVWVFG